MFDKFFTDKSHTHEPRCARHVIFPYANLNSANSFSVNFVMSVEEKRINEIVTSKLSINPVKHHERFQRTDKSCRNVNQRTNE